MKPSDLVPPFKWGEHYSIIQDGIFYSWPSERVFAFPGWEAIFGNENPIRLEFCSGNGHWITERAIADPNSNWVALDKLFMRTRKTWAKRKNYALENLLIVCGEALFTSKSYIPDQSVDEVFVNFPDPWPKRRHAKYRLVQENFVEEVARILKPGGSLMLVTDDIPYSEQMIEVLEKDKNYSSAFASPYFVTEFSGYGSSWFEDLFRRQDKSIRYMRFTRR